MAGESWIETTIGEQATLQRGIDITKAEQRDGRVPVISSGGVSSYHDTAAVKGPGVVLGRKGVVGSVFYVEEDYWPHDTSLWVKDFHGNYSRFVYYFFKSVAPQIARMDVGSANPTLNRNHVHPMPIVWPPLAEQKAIADVLGALDDKIELNRRMNATLEAMARALFQSWFVDFDPVRAKLDGRHPAALDPATAGLFPDSFQDSPIGRIPTGWDAIPLYDTAQWVNGAAFKSDDFCATGEGFPVIKIAELKDGISVQTKWCQRDAGADRIIDTGDLLYSWSGSPDTSLEAFLWSGGRGLLNQHIFKVISPTAAEKRFVYYLLQSLRPVLVETARNKQTTGLGHVTIADMKRLLVCNPSKEVLAVFDLKISPIFDKAFTNTLESRTLATLRDALLPKLLSGKITIRQTGVLGERS
jgi:type I restriction enzyme S subunit